MSAKRVTTPEVDVASLKLKVDGILKDSNQYGIFTSAAVSSVIGNRSLEFVCQYADGSGFDTRPDAGSILVITGKDGKESSRKGFSDYYDAMWGSMPMLEKLLAYWSCWLCDASGNQVALLGLLAQAFQSAGIRLPERIAKFTTTKGKEGRADKTVKEVFTKSDLESEILSAASLAEHVKAWIISSPTRSKKYGLTLDKPVRESITLVKPEKSQVDASVFDL